MKKLFLMFFVLLLAFGGGCNFSGSKTEPNNEKPQTNVTKQTEPKTPEKKYIVGPSTSIKGLEDWVERYAPYEGIFLQKKDDNRFILLSLGERLAGGYAVNVKRVVEESDKWVIEALFTEPKEPDFNTQEITYPNEVVSIIDDGKPIEVKNAGTAKTLEIMEIPEGKQLEISKSFIVTTPLNGDTIKNPVTVKGKARVFEASFKIHIEDGHKYLVEKIVMADEGAPEWGNFEITLPFDMPTSPNGSIILSVENMENGELIEEINLPVKFDQ